jgi:inorganic pyrophosphatase
MGVAQQKNMAHPWHGICLPATLKSFPVFIEIPAGSKAKYEIDAKTGLLKLSKFLRSSVRYPANYGFIPRTLAEDGDPLDVLLFAQEPLVPSVIVDARTIGGLRLRDSNELDDKIICVPSTDPFYDRIKSIKALPKQQLMEINQFFEQYKAIERKSPVIRGFMSRKQARKAITAARQRYSREMQ